MHATQSASLAIRLFRLAGFFGGVFATKVLAALREHPKSLLSRLAYQSIMVPESYDKANIMAAMEVFPEPSRVASLPEWPREFWSALSRLAERLPQDMEKDDLDLVKPDVNEGVSERVLAEFVAFMQTMEREGLRSKSGVQPWSEPERQARMVLGQIGTVLDRLPVVWKKYVQEDITFSITFDQDPEENEQVVRAAFRAGLPEKYGIRLDKARSLEEYDSEEVRSDEGWFQAEDLSIHLYPQHDAATVAHEVGHAIWERSLSKRTLRRYLQSYLDEKVLRSKGLKQRTEWAADDVAAFFRSLRKALSGMQMRDTETWMRTMEEKWGAGYAEEMKEVTMVRGLGRLLVSREDMDDLLDSVIDDNKRLLTTWNEAWAEGFVDVLLQGISSIEVPGCIISLIKNLLAMGQLP